MTAEHAPENDDTGKVRAVKKTSSAKKSKNILKDHAVSPDSVPQDAVMEDTFAQTAVKKPVRKSVARKKSTLAKEEINSDKDITAQTSMQKEQEGIVAQAETTKPKKQTRGKNSSVDADGSVKSTANSKLKTVSDTVKDEEKSAAVSLRKRGRPKKIVKEVNEIQASIESVSPSVEGVSTNIDENVLDAKSGEKKKLRTPRRTSKPRAQKSNLENLSEINNIDEHFSVSETDNSNSAHENFSLKKSTQTHEEIHGLPETIQEQVPAHGEFSASESKSIVEQATLENLPEKSSLDEHFFVDETNGADDTNSAHENFSLKKSTQTHEELHILPETIQEHVLIDDIQNHTSHSIELQEVPLESVAEKTVETAETTEESPVQENSVASKRGRRGGRGKRGKKRADLSHFPIDLEDEGTHKPLTKKNVGTSLNTGKPGIAQVTANKKVPESNAQRKMFISMVQGEQVEVAMVENGIIHEYYLEMLHQVKTKGNIYKGVVNNIDTNLQAAFINYGNHKNGFLQIDEIHPEYYQAHHKAGRGEKFPPIQKIIQPGQEILVQVVKEPTGNKGAFLTTWLSLAGRFLVLTPGQEQIGISRKVDNEEERSRLREMMTGIDPGKGLGVIVRTVSAGTSKTTLKSDLQYLKRVWKEIRKRGVSESAPTLLHRETNLSQRAIRDYLTDDVTEVWVDSTEMAENLRETVSLLFPRKKELIRIHADVRQTLWERFNMQRQLEQIYAREVYLPSGGRLVFDQTEALMAIDINSGKISGKGNFEAMALKTNLEAAETIARHLKLRDIGGQVVIDFIEMRERAHVREVEKTLKNAMKNDRARHDVARMSSFGLLEIVRQRTGSSALSITMEACPHCKGTGIRRNLEWQALQALCEIERKGRGAQGGRYIYETQFSDLALYLLNHKRQRIAEMEEQLKLSIEIRVRP